MALVKYVTEGKRKIQAINTREREGKIFIKTL